MNPKFVPPLIIIHQPVPRNQERSEGEVGSSLINSVSLQIIKSQNDEITKFPIPFLFKLLNHKMMKS